MGTTSHFRRRGLVGVLDCGCRVRLSRPQAIVAAKGQRIRVGCGVCRRTSYVRRVIDRTNS